MVSAETLLNYTDWMIPFTVHIYTSDKKSSAVISTNNKSISCLSRRSSKPQHNYNMTENELILILECLKKYLGVIFGYEINVFSDNKIWSMPLL